MPLVAPFLPLLVHQYLIYHAYGSIAALNLGFSDAGTVDLYAIINRFLYF